MMSSTTKPRSGNGDGQRSMTLIGRQWQVVLPGALLIYMFLEAILGSSSTTFCRTSGEHESFSRWTANINLIVASCFMLSSFHNTTMALLMGSSFDNSMDHPRSAYATSAVVSLIAGIASIISSTGAGKTSICKDSFGVETFNAQWAEWLTLMPLLGYITIAVEDKDKLSLEDLTVIGLMFFTIFFGFLLNVVPAENSKVCWTFLMLSCCCYSGNVIMTVSATRNLNDSNIDKTAVRSGWRSDRALLKCRLSWMLVLVMPIFPLLYLSRYFQAISRDGLVVGNFICGLFVKLSFVTILSLEAMHVQLSLESKANESRQQFLRYVFHEVRVPLNTMTMGLSVLKAESADFSEIANEVLVIMSSATSFMSETLNDVLSMSTIEDGAMTLEKRPFKLKTLISGSVGVIKGQAEAKDIDLVVEDGPLLFVNRQTSASMRVVANAVSSFRTSGRLKATNTHQQQQHNNVANWAKYGRSAMEFTQLLIGDRFRLEHVLVNLISNAVKFSKDGSKIKIKVSARLILGNSTSASAIASASANGAASARISGKVTPLNYMTSLRRPFSNAMSNVISKVSIRKSPALLAVRPDGISARSVRSVRGKGNDPQPAFEAVGGAARLGGQALQSFSLGAGHSAGDTYVEVTIVVEDRGVGISPENQKKLFVPSFAQIRPHELQSGSGSGLGLVLAREVITMHGGQLLMESVEGRGSSFGFRIRFAVAADTDPLKGKGGVDAAAASLTGGTTQSSASAKAAASYLMRMQRQLGGSPRSPSRDHVVTDRMSGSVIGGADINNNVSAEGNDHVHHEGITAALAAAAAAAATSASAAAALAFATNNEDSFRGSLNAPRSGRNSGNASSPPPISQPRSGRNSGHASSPPPFSQPRSGRNSITPYSPQPISQRTSPIGVSMMSPGSAASGRVAGDAASFSPLRRPSERSPLRSTRIGSRANGSGSFRSATPDGARVGAGGSMMANDGSGKNSGFGGGNVSRRLHPSDNISLRRKGDQDITLSRINELRPAATAEPDNHSAAASITIARRI